MSYKFSLREKAKAQWHSIFTKSSLHLPIIFHLEKVKGDDGKLFHTPVIIPFTRLPMSKTLKNKVNTVFI